MDPIRKIIHIDMDAFYASVEQRDNPDLKGQPVIVGGDPRGRGVVAACSYEARTFGIRSAMACSTAYRRCRRAVFVRPRFDVYQSVSRQIRDIFFQYTDLVEPLSLDEAFLDVTHNKPGIASATRIARQIRQQIFQATGGLTASAGVSFNKFLAKVASDVHKPDGITVITPQQAPAFIDQLPIRRFFGVGKATEEKMLSLGIKTGADLKNVSLQWLIDRFGKAGHYFFNIAHGRDRRPVQPDRQRKSYGKEITLKADIDDTNEMMAILYGLARRVLDGLQRVDHQGLTLTLKIKYADFRSITRSVTFPKPISDMAAVMDHLTQLLAHTDAGAKKVRLLGVSVSNFVGAREPGRGWVQLPLPLHFWMDTD